MNKAIWALRIGVAGEFIGHGILALGHKADWIPWFAKFGIGDPSTAATLLTLIGLLDILVALVVLIKPIKPIVLWAVFWGFWTALMRPIVNGWDDYPDFVERFANWAAPLALYYLLWKSRNNE